MTTLEPVTAKGIEIIMISLTQSKSHLEAWRWEWVVQWILEQNERVLFQQRERKNKINIGEETNSVSYTFVLNKIVFYHISKSHVLSCQHKVRWLIKKRSRIQIQVFQTSKPIHVLVLLHGWTWSHAVFPRKARLPPSWWALQELRQLPCSPKLDLQLGI